MAWFQTQTLPALTGCELWVPSLPKIRAAGRQSRLPAPCHWRVECWGRLLRGEADVLLEPIPHLALGAGLGRGEGGLAGEDKAVGRQEVNNSSWSSYSSDSWS